MKKDHSGGEEGPPGRGRKATREWRKVYSGGEEESFGRGGRSTQVLKDGNTSSGEG